MRSLLQPTPAQEQRFLRSHPTILRSSSALLQARYAMLKELMQARGAAGGVAAGGGSSGRRTRACSATAGSSAGAPHRRTVARGALELCTTRLRPPTPRGPQLDDAALRRFLLRVPSVLRLAEGRQAAHMAWLAHQGGVPPAKVVRAYLSWPQLATTSITMLQER